MEGVEPVILPVPELSPNTRAALVVATARYDDPAFSELRSPVRDVKDLAASLGDPAIGGFAVTTVMDQPDSQVRLAIAEFLAERKQGDTVLVYLSCHGIQDQSGRLFFAMTNTLKARPRASAVKSEDVLEELDDCKAWQQILILDCCFSGAFDDRHKGEVDLERQLVGHGRGRVVLTASRGYEYSFEGKSLDGVTLPGSVFTAGLVEGLRTGAADCDGDGYIACDEAFAYADRYVRDSGVKQTPQQWLSRGEGGKIILARNPAGRTVLPAKLPEDVANDLASRSEHLRIGAVNAVAEWLSDPDPARSLAATRALLDAAEHDNPRVAAAARTHLDRVRPPAISPRLSKAGESAADDDHQNTGTAPDPDAVGEAQSRQPIQRGEAGPYAGPEDTGRERESRAGDLLISVSGAEPDLLQYFPAERAKYVAYGSLILATAVMAGVAVALALHITLSLDLILSSVIGIMAGVFVMVLDRWLIMTMPRGRNALQTITTSLPRFMFGLILSVVVTTPIILQTFRPQIDQQMASLQTQHAQVYFSQLRNDPLAERINADQARVDQLDTIIAGAKNNANEVAAAKTELPAAQAELQADQAEQNQLTRSFEAANENNAGLLPAIQALGILWSVNGTLRTTCSFLFALFMIINLLPVIMKTLMSFGPESSYEKAVAYDEETGLRMAEIMRSRRLDRVMRQRNS
jgi:hypothetical protein